MLGSPVSGAAGAEVAANLGAIKARIERAAAATDRHSGEVTLVAVTKQQPQTAIREALRAGHRVFGENRVPEAQAKWPAIRREFAGIELHLIGPLQTNKAGDAVALFDVIESLDRPKLAAALVQAMTKLGRRPACFVQVNTGEEPQKAGVAPLAADAFIAACRETYKLPLAGLMCVPPANEPPAPHFALLAEIAKRNGLTQLSMGMSADFEIAIALGATHVRLGTAIFGARLG